MAKVESDITESIDFEEITITFVESRQRRKLSLNINLTGSIGLNAFY